MSQWWVFAHIVGVLAFVASHGVSMGVLFRLRKERDPGVVAHLLGLSSWAISWFYPAFGLLLGGGIGAAFALSLWGKRWIWLSIAILVVVTLVMYLMATPYYRRVRFISQAMAEGSQAVSPAQFDQVLRSSQPNAIAAIGILGLLAILYLMVFQPSLGASVGGVPGPVPRGSASGPDLTVASRNTAFAPTSLQAPSGDVTVTLVNEDPFEHDFTVDALGVMISTGGNERASATFRAVQGTYEFYCSVPGHRAAGMVGTLTITEGGASP